MILKCDPIETLRQCSAPVFKSYLVWRGKYSRITKESSIHTYWKVLSRAYCDNEKAWMDGAVLYDIGNVVTACLLRDTFIPRNLQNEPNGFQSS